MNTSAAGASAQRGCKGPVSVAARQSRTAFQSRRGRHHADTPNQALPGAAAAAATLLSSSASSSAAAATVAASTIDQLHSQDPALDSLIDRWLSHKHASTSGSGQPGSSNGSSGASANGSSSNGSGSKRQQQQQSSLDAPAAAKVEWEALLGPVSATVTSLTTLEEGDEVFALSDSLSHLGGSLQELQQLATQLLHQQQQQQQQPQEGATQLDQQGVAQYTQQLVQLLSTASQSAAALDDTGLINLLAIATVLLTTNQHTATGSNNSNGHAAVHAAAAAAVQSACAELWQRPGMAAGLDAAQLTSLTVILRRLSKLAVRSSELPVALPLSAYKQMQQLAAAGQLSLSQLGVCCWCLSGLAVAPPADAVAAALSAAASLSAAAAAAAAAGTASSSSSRRRNSKSSGSSSSSSSDLGADGLALRRLAAAAVNWQPWVAAGVSGTAASSSSAAAVEAAGEFVQSAAQAAVQVVESSTAASSSSSSQGVWKVVAAVAQVAASYSVFPGEAFAEAVGTKLLQQQQQQSAPTAAAEGADTTGAAAAALARESQDVAAAAGCLLPWWASNYDSARQELMVQAVVQQHQQQPAPVPLLHSFLAAALHSCSATGVSTDLEQQQLHSQLEAIGQQLVGGGDDGSSASHATCVALLLRLMVVTRCRSQLLLPLTQAAQHTLQDSSVVAAADTKAAAAAVAEAAAALCQLAPTGWEQQLQQLVPLLLDTGSGSHSSPLQQLELTAVIAAHRSISGSQTAAAAASGATELAAAVLRHLLQPSTLAGASAQQAADLLVLLTVGQPPWKLSTGQQLQAAPPRGLAQLLSSSSSSGADDRGEAVSMLQQQCLRCMGVVVQDAGRSLLPGQLVPVLASLTYVQQQQQRQDQQEQQWWFGAMRSRSQLPTIYRQLHREALAAISLQLQDAASLLAPRDLAWSTRLLALLQLRPSLALGAVVQAAASCVGAFKQQDLVWMLWGLTKLRFIGEQRLQQQLLSAALQAAAAGAQVEEDDTEQLEQEWQQQQGSTAWEEEEEGSGDSGDRSAAEFDADVALLWVAASRGSQDPAVAQVLQHTVQAPVVPRLAQVASLVWSHTRLLQSSGVQQQQQQPQNKQQGQRQPLLEQVPRVVQLAECSLASDAAVQQLLPRHIAVLTWGLHKLGHKPSGSALAALSAAALACAQPAQQGESGTSSSSAAGPFLPGELSCFLHCMASWDVQLQQEELQQLAAHVQQQLAQDLQVPGDNSSRMAMRWDGAAVCSACWSLAQLGAATPHSMLAAAEQYLLKLLPKTAAALTGADGSAASSSQPAQQAAAAGQRQQQQQQSLPPSAADLVLFGTACRAAGYKPLQLLQAFRGWVLMQLAQKGPAGLVALQANFKRHKGGQATTGQHRAARSNASVAWRVASPVGGNASAAQQGGQQQATSLASPWGNANLHAHAAVSTLLFLRQTGFDEPLLLHQLETVSLQEPVFQQLQPRQVVMLLSSFCQLGYVPEQWLGKQGVRRLTRLVLPDGPVVPSKGGATARSGSSGSSSGGESSGSSAGSSLSGSKLSAQDCVELLECLSRWCSHPQLSGNTLLWQCIFPGLLQLLLGVQYKPANATKQAAAGAAAMDGPSAGSASSNSSSNSSSNGRGGGSVAESASSSPAPAGASKGSKASSTSTSNAAPNLLLTMPGWQVVSVLRSLVQLDTPRAHKQLQQQVLQQLVRRLQQVWPELPLQQRVAAAHAASRAGYDLSGTLGVQELMAQHPLTPQQQPPQHQQQEEKEDDEGRSLPAAVGSSQWQFATASASSRLLWIFGNAGRHPGPQVFSTTLSAVTAAAAAAVQAGEPLPLREVSTVLYAVTVLQELQNPAVAPLLQQLQQSATQGTLLTHPQFAQQSEQLAACYLAAKDAAQAGGTPPPAPVASFDMDQGSAASLQNPGRQSNSSPWLSLPAAVQQRLVEAWRRKVLRKAGPKAGSRKGMGEHMQLLLSLRQLGLRGRAKVLTDDGLVCIDVAVTTAQGDRIAVELLGPHNAALNTQRPLGPARLKWRMLAHRGYKVVVVNTWQWRTLDPGFVNRAGSGSSGSVSATGGSGSGSGSGSVSSISSSVGGSDGAESSLEEYDGSVMSEKLLYLQSRLEAALGPAGAAALLSGGGARSLRPGPQLVRLDESGRGLVQQQVVQQQRGL